MMRFLAALFATALTGVAGFHVSARPLSPAQRGAVISAHEWHQGCPTTLTRLRVLTVSYLGFDSRTHTGQLVVNEAAVAPLRQVFRRLFELHFPDPPHGARERLRARRHPADGDVTAAFECRQARPPLRRHRERRTGNWSEHAYGEAVDLNPVENPYVGCGMTRDKSALSYLDRTGCRRGMVTPAVVAAFADAGWGAGGSWTGSTKDYMHFSATGH